MGEGEHVEEEPGHSLLLAFDTDALPFVRGFEAGVLWAQLRASDDELEATVHTENVEMVMRLSLIHI